MTEVARPEDEKVTGPLVELIEKARKWPREGFGEGQLFNELADEVERLWRALKMIADETICPELWRPSQRKDWSDDELAYKTALVIATAAIEGKANGE